MCRVPRPRPPPVSSLTTKNAFFKPRQIWDTAGQEKYHSLAPMYYRGAGAAIVVYDITKMHSFRTLKEWVNELQAQGPQDIAIAIAGNKRDLESERVSIFWCCAVLDLRAPRNRPVLNCSISLLLCSHGWYNMVLAQVTQLCKK